MHPQTTFDDPAPPRPRPDEFCKDAHNFPPPRPGGGVLIGGYYFDVCTVCGAMRGREAWPA